MRVTLEGAEGGETLDGTHLLLAAGRRPELDDLGLDEAGIAFDARGIKVERAAADHATAASMRSATSCRRAAIHALGELPGGARRPLDPLPLRRQGAGRSILPWVTFTEPELAHVGLSEAEARRRTATSRSCAGRSPRTTAPRRSAPRAAWSRSSPTQSGRILGADILGRDAGELIAPFVLAVARAA